MTTYGKGFNRRTLMRSGAVGAAAVLLGSATAAHAAEGASEEENPTAAEEEQQVETAEGASPAAAGDNAAKFLRRNEFFIAHRGSGDVNPEHTAYAYAESVRRGAEAVEISVHTTSDGKAVCIHDPSLQRTAGSNMVVRENSLDRLRSVYVNMRKSLGEATPLEPIPTLDEALNAIDAVNKNTVLFIEAKDSPAQRLILDTVKKRGIASRTVIKMFRDGGGGNFNPNSNYLRQAKAAGCQTWCYFKQDEELGNIQRMASHDNVDALGVPYYENTRGATSDSMSEEDVRRVVSYGKPVIVWEVHRRSVYQRFRALGVRGFMSPDPFWVSGRGFEANLKLESGRRQHGVIPSEVSNAKNMPDWKRGSITHNQPYDESVLLGPLANVTGGENYTLEFTLRWEGQLPASNWQYGYIAFGRSHDGPLGLGKKFRGDGSDGCYVLAIRPKSRVRNENGHYVSGDIIQLLHYDPATSGSEPKVLHAMKLNQPLAADRNIEGKIIVKKDYFYYVVNSQYSSRIHNGSQRGPYVHFGRYHGNKGGGPLALVKMNARDSWA